MTRETRLATISNALDTMPATMTRAEYEALCGGIEIDALTDANILTGNFKYGDYDFSSDPTGAWRIRQVASQRRASGITAERKPTPKPAAPQTFEHNYQEWDD